MVKHRSPHADDAIRERALVGLHVLIVDRCESDKESYENSHLVSPSLPKIDAYFQEIGICEIPLRGLLRKAPKVRNNRTALRLV